jgi:sortase A
VALPTERVGTMTRSHEDGLRRQRHSVRVRNVLRRLGLVLMIVGCASLLWAVVVWRWQDPFTALYTTYEQHQLQQAYHRRVAAFRLEPRPLPASPVRTTASDSSVSRVAQEERRIALAARRYRLESREGNPLGKIIVPRLGLSMVFLDGTDEASLEKGPGRDLQTFMPGEDRLVYIAGHRTTFLAPFADIDRLRPGDRITLELPYATFVYAVTRHVVVPATDLAVLRSGARELLALQACHPRFFATHRYIVYARPTRVIPGPGLGSPYAP